MIAKKTNGLCGWIEDVASLFVPYGFHNTHNIKSQSSPPNQVGFFCPIPKPGICVDELTLCESGGSEKNRSKTWFVRENGKIFYFLLFCPVRGRKWWPPPPFPIADHRSGSGVFPLTNVKSAIFLAPIIVIAYLCVIVGNAMGTPMAPHARPWFSREAFICCYSTSVLEVWRLIRRKRSEYQADAHIRGRLTCLSFTGLPNTWGRGQGGLSTFLLV